MDENFLIDDLDWPFNIKDEIRDMTLFHKELTVAFRDEDLVFHTLEALSVIELTETMKKEMEIEVEEWIKTPLDKRGARMDILIRFLQ